MRGRSVELGIRPAHNPGHSINVTKGSNDCEMGSNPALAAPLHWGQTIALVINWFLYNGENGRSILKV